MTRRAQCCGWIAALFAASCAGHPAPSRHAALRAHEVCSSIAQAGVSAETSQRLARASNVIDYQNTWKEAHPGAALGTVHQSEISLLIHAKTPEVQRCYESALARLHDGRGRVVVRFVIDAAGKVPNVSISANDFDDPEVGCCIAQHIARWAFPSPSDGDFVAVEYPFVVRISNSK